MNTICRMTLLLLAFNVVNGALAQRSRVDEGDSFSNAIEVASGGFVFGNLSGDDIDYFQFVLAEGGNYFVELESELEVRLIEYAHDESESGYDVSNSGSPDGKARIEHFFGAGVEWDPFGIGNGGRLERSAIVAFQRPESSGFERRLGRR